MVNPWIEKRKQTKTSCVQTSPLWKAKIRSYASSENLRRLIHKPNPIPKVENRIKEVPVRYNVGVQVNISKPRGIRLRNFIRKDSLKRDSIKRRSSKKYSRPSDAEIRQVWLSSDGLNSEKFQIFILKPHFSFLGGNH